MVLSEDLSNIKITRNYIQKTLQSKKTKINTLWHFVHIPTTLILISSIFLLLGSVIVSSTFDYEPLSDFETQTIIQEAIENNKRTIIRTDNTDNQLNQEITHTSTTNLLIIPKLGVTIQIHSGDESSLEKGIWNRYPKRSSPSIGGNFVLSGHRFVMGTTPENTRKQSPLFNINRLELNDSIKVVWGSTVYDYSIEDIFWVPPTAVEIEENNFGDILTLYTCDLGGESSGRVVIRAKNTALN